MARRIEIDGERWYVYPSGRVTANERDEFGVVFEKGSGPDRVRRIARYSPLGARRWDAALQELSDAQLNGLFRQSQGSALSPEIRHGERTDLPTS